jgi:hypothetical protein
MFESIEVKERQSINQSVNQSWRALDSQVRKQQRAGESAEWQSGRSATESAEHWDGEAPGRPIAGERQLPGGG